MAAHPAFFPFVSGLLLAALAALILWPSEARSQGDASIPLVAGWNNVSYHGDLLPIEDALNDALPIVDTVTRWDAASSSYDTWNKGAPSIEITLPDLAPGDVVWLETSDPGEWTKIGGAQVGQPGTDSLSCWDLDGDGEFDPEEDLEADDVANALDY